MQRKPWIESDLRMFDDMDASTDMVVLRSEDRASRKLIKMDEVVNRIGVASRELHEDPVPLSLQWSRLVELENIVAAQRAATVASEVAACVLCGEPTVIFDEFFKRPIHLRVCRPRAYTILREVFTASEV